MKEYIPLEEATTIPVLPKGQRVEFRNIDEAFEAGWKTCQEYIATCIEPADVISRHEAIREMKKIFSPCGEAGKGEWMTPTREIIKLLKEYGNHVQILTKGDGSRDFDLLDGEDWYGVTMDGSQSTDSVYSIINTLRVAKAHGIHTWVSFEPVLNANEVIKLITCFHRAMDKVKIGKLNYHPSDINWKEFGIKTEALCQTLGLDYYIKDSLRKEMEKE